MTDVFISYARSTEQFARHAGEALRSLGYDVWRDEDIPAHRGFAGFIAERLAEASAVLVIWSADAAKSEWVQSEADRARNDGKLVQLRIDPTPLPMPFDRIQCADLTGWNGDLEAHAWRTVVSSIADLTGEAEERPPVEALPSLPSRPTLAVMPFSNLSSEGGQDYFAEGMVEDVITALARFKSLYVVSAGSSLVSKGKLMGPHEAARQLGVRYLLEGSIRRAGGRVRVTVHLVDAENNAELWTERFDDQMEDVFALQDRVAERIAGVIEPTVQDSDRQKAAARPTQSLSAYDLYLRASWLFRISRKSEMLESTELLDRAIALDPNFAHALGQSCVSRRQLIDHDWCDDTHAVRNTGLEYAERALRIASDDARVVASVAAGLPGLEDSLDRALLLTDRAIALNPSSSFVWLISGSIQLRNGDPETAATHLEAAMRLDPISSMNGFARMYLASARFQQERFDEALTLFRTTTLRLPVSYAVLASLHGHLGQADLARTALAQFHALEAGELEKYTRIWFPRPEYRKLLLDGIAAVDAVKPVAG